MNESNESTETAKTKGSVHLLTVRKNACKELTPDSQVHRSPINVGLKIRKRLLQKRRGRVSDPTSVMKIRSHY